METPKEYYYTYYSYEEWGRGYIGSRGCKCLPEEDVRYFGTFKDKTFKPTQKIILKDDYATREEAIVDEIVLQQHYKVVENPHFANKAYQTSTKFSYIPSREEATKNGKRTKELGVGVHGWTKKQMSENGKKAGKIGGKISGKINGKLTYELGIGIFSLTPEQKTENAKKGGKLTYELGIGIHSQTPEQRSEGGKKGGAISANQKWKCLETGFITNAGNLTKYQRARGIDTSQRVRVSNSWGL
jgi:general stress protein YciG